MIRILTLIDLVFAFITMIIIMIKLAVEPPKPRRELIEEFTWWPPGHIHRGRGRK